MLGFIIAIFAGFLTPQLEGPLAGPIIKALDGHIAIDPTEKRLVAFMAAILIAGIAAALLSSGSAFWIMFGGVLGYFGTRLVTLGKKLANGTPPNGEM